MPIGALPDDATAGVPALAPLVVLQGSGAEQAGGAVLLTGIAPREQRGRCASPMSPR